MSGQSEGTYVQGRHTALVSTTEPRIDIIAVPINECTLRVRGYPEEEGMNGDPDEQFCMWSSTGWLKACPFFEMYEDTKEDRVCVKCGFQG